MRVRAEKRGEREDTFEARKHNSAASRENGRTSGSRSRVTKMDDIRARNKSTGGTQIEKNMRERRVIYRRERESRLRKRQSRLYRSNPYGRPETSRRG